ncbi:MAG: hypothetical protein ABF876_05480 [Acetobacter aceti]
MNQKKNYGIDRAALCPMRQAVMDAVAKKDISLAELSRIAGKSDGYMHSFLTRSIPKYLPEAPRAKVAQALEIDERLLMSDKMREAIPAFSSLAAGRVTPSPVPSQIYGEIPSYRDSDDLSAAPTGFATRPSAGADVTQIVALWISRSRGRLRSGDIAYADRSRKPRDGDTALAMRDGNIIALGDYRTDNDGTIRIDEDERQTVQIDPDVTDLWKIRWIETR